VTGGLSGSAAGGICARSVVLTKHHGIGNDFLVLLDPKGQLTPSPDEVRALCDRHRGIGADGVLVGRPGSGGADLQMVLTNADGSPAEMSGNGIRCLVQGAVDAGMVKEGIVIVDSDGGRRRVDYRTQSIGLGYAEVEMGEVSISGDLGLDVVPVSLAPAGSVLRAVEVNVGNPHVVLLAGGTEMEIGQVGPLIEGAVVGGVNVELIRVAEGHSDGTAAIDLEVWERGVGLTDACGTGSCAGAAAAKSWGIAGSRVDVNNPGGTLRVTLGEAGVTLAGPTRMVGEVKVDLEVLSALVAEHRTEDERRKEVVAAL
jgi:diaminopimelate epimerase